jgi:serine/threonine protein kinase
MAKTGSTSVHSPRSRDYCYPRSTDRSILADVKPDNILVNWACDKEGNKIVTDVALGDYDIAFKSKGGEPRQTPYAIGNAMWRSPEGQTGKGVTKASDVFSFGLVVSAPCSLSSVHTKLYLQCIYALGGGDFLLLNHYQELATRGITPEQEILIRHFSYFGSVPEGLLRQVSSENWCNALKAASEMAEEAVKEQPELSFESWGKELGFEAQHMIRGMTKPDPAARTTINQVMAHIWWQGVN